MRSRGCRRQERATGTATATPLYAAHGPVSRAALRPNVHVMFSLEEPIAKSIAGKPNDPARGQTSGTCFCRREPADRRTAASWPDRAARPSDCRHAGQCITAVSRARYARRHGTPRLDYGRHAAGRGGFSGALRDCATRPAARARSLAARFGDRPSRSGDEGPGLRIEAARDAVWRGIRRSVGSPRRRDHASGMSSAGSAR